MRFGILIFILFLISGNLPAQRESLQVSLEPVAIDQLDGIQSFAFGQHEGYWLIIGGRLDGLHRRQPWATFLPDGQNKLLTVVHPEQKQVHHAPLTSLPLPLQDQLSSTNMQFFQEGNTLYLTGGYGHSETVGSKVTYAMLTAIDVPGLINAIVQQTDITSYFRTLTDTQFAVAGGHLKKIYDTYYLLGGHHFEGDYNPMNHATFIQTYTNAVRRFRILDDGLHMVPTFLPAWVDTAAFHRRDYNAGEIILPNGEEGIMNFSGPFQVDADLPYLNTTEIDSQGYEVVPGFAQYFNNYHCPHIPLYAAAQEEMHTLFFGGIAQYYEEGGNLVQDNDVPFVKTITRVTRDRTGQMTEYKLPVEMPDYLGAGAEFIPLTNLPVFSNRVIRLDELPQDRTHVGYIFGGIRSSAANIFWLNDGTQSEAHPIVYEVWLSRQETSAIDIPNEQSYNGLQMQIFPNPNDGYFNINFSIEQPTEVHLRITSGDGNILVNENITHQVFIGQNHLEKNIKPFQVNGIYFVTLITDDQQATQKIIVKP